MTTMPTTDDVRARVAALADPDRTEPTTAELLGTLGGIRGLIEAADMLSAQGRTIPDDARLKGVKQAVASGLRQITEPQAEYNTAMVDAVLTIGEVLHDLLRSRRAVEELTTAVDGLTDAVERFALQATRADEAAASAASTPDAADHPTYEYLLERVQELRTELAGVLGAAPDAPASSTADELRARIAILQARQNLLARRITGDSPTARDAADDHDPAATTFDRLYEHFEDRFRGTRAFVTEMLEPYIDDLAGVDAPGPVIDIGCGRGEWLELLRTHDIDAYGLDHNTVAVARCRERGLDARDDDVIDHLTGLTPGSVRAITAFHVVEHLPFDATVAFLDAAMVTLAPDGMLILETPNPTNLTVGGSFFWIDPTHIRPMHPDLLEFLVTERGFVDAEVRYLHPRDHLRLDPDHLVAPGDDADSDDGDTARTVAAVERVNDWIFGHLDYVVIARKPTVGPTA